MILRDIFSKRGVSKMLDSGESRKEVIRPDFNIAFSLGAFLWDMSGVFMAPGALLIARKPPREK